MFRIGYRTLKTAFGAAIAILIAQMLGLDFFASAGILTILCIQKTRKRSFKSAWNRFLACMIGLVIASIIFETLGYMFYSVAIVLLLFIPVTVRLKITSGIVTSAVIMFHLYTVGNVTVGLLWNEVQLISIGIGMSLLMNAYMPSVEDKLGQMQKELEEDLSIIFKEFASYIRTGESEWAGKEITDASELVNQAKNASLENLENHILRYEDMYYHYFKMREKQLDIIERLMPLLTSIDYHVDQADMLADFLEELSEGVNAQNTAYIFIEKLEELRSSYKEMELPDSREEFEARAALANVVRELDQYLAIKQQFKPIQEYRAFE
ncbi:aromatic acid exporter family protein [Paenalkalicoccus suaedae]|uniref:Aromatic acid exporter family protein n=1 Tax=Paenalkalicoccus suaedae TaxID=2592382 RepID=A0A859FFJ9_9BACI|nr:aromatic acid exporter family protein [Paenalkalicoccus suaedae]QKS70985.1 aromatic acid exporter family protein [Paenalkalicoccus suaedae]